MYNDSLIDSKGNHMQAWRMRALLVAIIVLLPFEVILIVALWPYLDVVGKAFMGFLVTCFVCGSVAVIDWAWKRIKAPIIIVERDVVVMMTKTGIEHLSAKHEAAKLALPAPVTVTEVIEKDDEVQRSSVLVCHDMGLSIQAIAKATNVKPWKVQKWTSDYEKAKKGKQNG